MQEITEILTEIGYKLTPDKDGWRARPIYRESGNDTSLKIYSNGSFTDFSAGISGSFEELVKLSTGLKDIDEVKKWLNGKIDLTNLKTTPAPKIQIPEVFDENILVDLILDYSYWEKSGIDSQTASLFKGGLVIESNTILGKLKNRQVLLIYNSQNKLVGFTGRSLDDKNKIKWRHIGQRSSWVWPAYLSHKYIQETKSVVLVESPRCIMKMWSCGIKNTLCLFGTELSYSILNYLLKIHPRKLYIATNNEPDNNSIGNKAAEKVYSRLKRYFNSNQLEIKLPPKKDFGECSCAEIIKYYESIS